MPRTARRDHEGAVHHVMVRGIERREIFHDDVDRARFLFRLEAALLPAGTACFAWALMPNHVHLLLRTGPVPLAVAMHRLGTTYAMDFNTRHGRAGHLFQNRYKALPVESDAYLTDALRYIHLNPVRAGLVEDLDGLETWPWTGHRALMGRGRCGFQSVEVVLRGFGADADRARTALRIWMGEFLPLAGAPGPAEGSGAAGPVEPDPAGIPEGSHHRGGTPRSMRADELREGGWDLARLTRWVCSAMGVSEAALRAGRRARDISEARAVIAWFAWSDLAVSQADLGRHLGVGSPAVSQRMALGRALAGRLGLDPFREALGGVPPWEVLQEASGGG